MGPWKKQQDSQEACNGVRAYADSLPLGFSTRATAGRAPVAHWEKLKGLASGQVLGDGLLPDRTPEARQQHCPLSKPCTPQSHRAPPGDN